MGGQFSDLLTAVYCLYSERYDSHTNCRGQIYRYRHDWDHENEKEDIHTITTEVLWDEEGRMDEIRFIRRDSDFKAPTPDRCDPIDVELVYWGGTYRYTVDARDMCYALAKAATKALKKYGFRGYHSSSGSCECYGDSINIEQLLFVKAYALNAMEVRELKEVWSKPCSWMRTEGTSFEKELELLLFDM